MEKDSKEEGLGNLTYIDVNPDTDIPAVGMKNNIPAELILSIKSGNHHAFERLFHMFYKRVKSFIRIITTDDNLAEELSQQLFVDLWINRERIDPDKNISSYLFTIAKNSALTAIRQQLKYEMKGVTVTDQPDNSQPDQQIIIREMELMINLVIAAMPPKRRQVYEMSRYENKTNDEIANELNISRKVVERHIRLAVNDIKESLQSVF